MSIIRMPLVVLALFSVCAFASTLDGDGDGDGDVSVFRAGANDRLFGLDRGSPTKGPDMVAWIAAATSRPLETGPLPPGEQQADYGESFYHAASSSTWLAHRDTQGLSTVGVTGFDSNLQSFDEWRFPTPSGLRPQRVATLVAATHDIAFLCWRALNISVTPPIIWQFVYYLNFSDHSYIDLSPLAPVSTDGTNNGLLGYLAANVTTSRIYFASGRTAGWYDWSNRANSIQSTVFTIYRNLKFLSAPISYDTVSYQYGPLVVYQLDGYTYTGWIMWSSKSIAIRFELSGFVTYGSQSWWPSTPCAPGTLFKISGVRPSTTNYTLYAVSSATPQPIIALKFFDEDTTALNYQCTTN